MSSHSQGTSETTPLLPDAQLVNQFGIGFACLPETLLIPVALATRLASSIQMTTFVEFVRLAVCRIWNRSYGDDPTTFSSNLMPLNSCDSPEIARYFSAVVATIGTIEGILSIVGCGALSRISSNYGRKPAFSLVLVTGFVGACLIPMSQYLPDWLGDLVFLVGMLFQLFSGPALYTYLVNVYVVDVCPPENRTTALSKIAGWVALGTCISYALGGFVTTKTGNNLIVFYTSAVICIVTLLYVGRVLPESFPKEERDALSRMRLGSSAGGFSSTLHSTPLLVFAPVRILMSARKADGTSNWRLAWCAMHIFMFMTVNGYVTTSWIVLVTSKYHLSPADTGLFLAVVTTSSTVFLTVVVPPLVRFLRPYYSRKVAHIRHGEEDVDAIVNDEELVVETSDQLDVHLALVSCVVTGVFYLSAAASTTNIALILSGICIGITYVHMPTIRSLVAGSVDPLRQGEALAAIEIISNAGACLSPVIMGSLVTATLNTAPLLAFYVHLAVAVVSSVLLLFVRDADRYHLNL